MKKLDFRNERLYQTTMHIVRRMLSDGIITEDEYHKADEMFLKKYKPVFGTLFSDLSLTFTA